VAGGLNEANIADALRLRPYGIDLVSSVEEVTGRKSREKMKSLMKKVRSYDL
jgi:phosphoribosylanthranilate isomerase